MEEAFCDLTCFLIMHSLKSLTYSAISNKYSKSDSSYSYVAVVAIIFAI